MDAHESNAIHDRYRPPKDEIERTDVAPRSTPANARSIVQRFSLVPLGGAILLAGAAVMALDDPDVWHWVQGLIPLLAAAWIVRWDVRRRRRAISLRIDDEGALYVRDAEGERPLAWNRVTRLQVSLVNSLMCACIGMAAIASPFAAMLSPSPDGSAVRLLAVFFFGGGFGALCLSEAYGRFFWLPLFLPGRRWSVWFSMSEFEALTEEAKARARNHFT